MMDCDDDVLRLAMDTRTRGSHGGGSYARMPQLSLNLTNDYHELSPVVSTVDRARTL
jgi:hypothetical protein